MTSLAQDTPDSLLPRIIELWHELAVPLAYRSRFYLTFSKKELFFSELEHRRLEWKLSQWRVTGGGAERDKALRALDWERKSLARALKLSLDDAGRDALFAAWGVNSDTKERKLQLVHK
ncbi:kinesin motor domain-containing protein [Haematococcus lacustris]|uniref:Kinesin motor domain-containing protein n=1 Tax=Haematococcus lacustris TaxID=44745 RepID=A0A699YCH0_HAELA|nr:kinesin motor domain-containing protein [Haematococcus lacustris]